MMIDLLIETTHVLSLVSIGIILGILLVYAYYYS